MTRSPLRLFLLGLLCLLSAVFAPAAEKADRIIVADHVVTMDARWTILEPGALAVRGGAIVAVGAPADVKARFTAPVTDNLGNRWVLPGLVNVHTHIPMNPMRGLGDDLELMTWLQKYIFPLEAKAVNSTYVYEASLAACGELIRRGVTTIVDMYYFEDDEARAVKEAGLRGFLGETIIDFPAPDCKTPAEALDYTEKCLRKWAADPMVKVIPSPHSVYLLAPEWLKKAKALADKYSVPMTIHLSESADEVKQVREKTGKTPVQLAFDLGILGPNVLAAHCVVLTPEDREILRKTGTAVAHNPDSNTKLASGVAPIPELLSLGVRVGLGTDGSVSNNRQDLFHAMDLAAKIQKVTRGDATVLPARDLVRMATMGGAEALGQSARIGSLEAGKQADLMVVDLSAPEYAPVYNIYSHLVYVAHGEAVSSVMAGGKWLMKNKVLLTLQEKRLREINEKYRKVFLEIVKGK